jgi:hypothetical protein
MIPPASRFTHRDARRADSQRGLGWGSGHGWRSARGTATARRGDSGDGAARYRSDDHQPASARLWGGGGRGNSAPRLRNVLKRDGARARLLFGGHDPDLEAPGDAIRDQTVQRGAAMGIADDDFGAQTVDEGTARASLGKVKGDCRAADRFAGLLRDFDRERAAAARTGEVHRAFAFHNANLEDGNLGGCRRHRQGQPGSETKPIQYKYP